MKRKILALTLSAALVLTLLPATALAQDNNHDGFNDNDYNKIQTFLNTKYNGVENYTHIAGYNKDNMSTWGVVWTSDGGVNYASTINWENIGIGGALDLSGCIHLINLNAGENNLTSLDLSNGIGTDGTIKCQENGLTTLNVSGSAGIKHLTCNSNQISALDLGSLTDLTDVTADHNNLGKLDVTKNTKLTSLNCGTNRLTSLDVTKNTSLNSLDCGANQLTSLDVTKNTNLTTLDCGVNQMTSLDVTNNTALLSLTCQENQLGALNVNNCTELWKLDCSSNQLSALDISHNTKLTTANLNSNRLSALDMTNNRQIGSFTSASNPLTDINARFLHLNAGYGGYLSLELQDPDPNPLTIIAAATPINGAALINWTNADKSEASTAPIYHLTYGKTNQLTANFLVLQPSPASGKLFVGDKLTLTPSITGGTWSFDSSYFSRDGNTFTALKAGKCTIKYTLDKTQPAYEFVVYNLSNISASVSDAAYGSVTGTGAYRPDTTVNLHATANKGYHFVRWTENGMEVSTSADYSFKVTGDRPLVAVFEKDAAVAITCVKTDVTRYGGSDGSITVKASGGHSGSYEYSISNGATWQSSARFTGLKAGAYKVLARDAGNTANVSSVVSVTIKQITPTAYMANKLPSKANAGAVWLVKPVAAPKGYTLKSVSFASGSKSIATTNAAGIVCFNKGGKVKLTVTMVYKKGNATKTVKIVKQITVNQKITAITLNKTVAGLKVKKTLKLSPKIYPASATNKTVKWKSSNTKVATVSASGVVTGKAKGTAVITCTAKDGSNVSAKCTVTVN